MVRKGLLRGLVCLQVLLSQEVSDTMRMLVLDTVRIEATRSNVLLIGETSVDKVARLLSALHMAYRGVPFAQEVVYQGFLPHQTQITIEGMRLLPACVDKMDPVISYIEGPIIEGADWEGKQNWGVMPTLSVGLLSVEGSPGGQAYLLGGDNYHRLFANVQHRQKGERFSFVSALTYRLGSYYRTGKNLILCGDAPSLAWARDTILSVPSYTRLNAFGRLSYKINAAQRLEVAYLSDLLNNMSYPALIMDTEHQTMHLVSVRHVWRNISDIRLYANTLYHFMTDEGRPQEEIRNRIVMPNMYMPMKGITRTIGASWNMRWWQKGSWQLSQHTEYTNSSAYAFMNMEPLDRGVPMSLANLADVRFSQGGVTLSATFRSKGWYIQGRSGMSVFLYNIGDSLEFLPLRLYQDLEVGGSNPRRDFVVYQVGLTSSWERRGHKVSLSFSQGTRPPTHMELYGYYLYVPMDNSIWMGNSLLKPEGMWRGEFGYEYTSNKAQLQVSFFSNYLRDYIAPVTFLAAYAPGNATPQQWRILKNTGEAFTGGIALQGSLQVLSFLLLEGWGGYTYGWHITLMEPLPWIYPLYGRLRMTSAYKSHRLSIEVYGANSQRHLSRTIYIEDYTPAYVLFHLRYGYLLAQLTRQDKDRIRLTLMLSIENLLNTYGWDHLSVGNMPFLGRVLRGGLSLSW
ncbi:MAG: TonB-dependent receptor [Bacteroidia bacterium]|nr:TonB-dependent receptor [Bacteroidia bacterium]MDW8133777.1 TonB-dependent receptor [Bacteroidia bacterium]